MKHVLTPGIETRVVRPPGFRDTFGIPLPEPISTIVVGYDVPAWLKTSAKYVCSGTDDQTIIQKAISEMPSTRWCMTLIGTFNTTGVITFSGNPDAVVVDASQARFVYNGTGIAIDLVLHRAQVAIGEITATGDGATSATANAIRITGAWTELHAYINGFNAGIGLRIGTGSNLNYIPFLRIRDTKIGVTTSGDGGGNIFGLYTYDCQLASGVTNGIVLEQTGTGLGYYECVFQNLNANWYPTSGNFTILSFANFNWQMIIESLTGESDSTGKAYIANMTWSTGNMGVVKVGEFFFNQGSTGKNVLTGNAVNIRHLGDAGNINPVFEPKLIGDFIGANVTPTIDTANGRQTTNSVSLTTFGAPPVTDAGLQVAANRLFPSPGSHVGFSYAVRSDRAGVLLFPWLDSYSKTPTQLQAVTAPYFEVPAINTWYYVSCIANVNVVPLNTASATMQFQIDHTTVINGTILKLSELSVFAPAGRATTTAETILSGTFAIDSAGVKTVTITHTLGATPAKEDCSITVMEDTAVDDWAFNLLKVTATSGTTVTVRINVSTASGTAGATAKLGLVVLAGY